MLSRTITVTGVVYIRSRDAARETGVSIDYVSRLARAGLVIGQQVDGLWFVSLESLKEFLTDQQRQKQAWRARLAEMRREEQRLAGHPSATH